MKPTSDVEAERTRPELHAYLWCIRYQDVLLLQGSPLLGAAFALKEITVESAASMALLALAGFLLVAHIFTFNDWAGIASDSKDPNKSANVFSTKGITPGGVLLLSAGLLAASLLLFALLPARTCLVAVAIAALGIFYSHPSINAKAMPIVSSSPHLVGGALHFLLGYSLFSGVDGRGVLIALFFALTFTAGHLNQEVRDYDGDRLNGLLTNAVAFGRTAAFVAGFLGFTLAYGDLVVLAHAGLIPASLGVVPLALYPLHVLWSVRTFRAGLTFENVSKFQGRYRMLYALIGLTMVVTLLRR